MSTQWENPTPQRDQWCPTPTSDASRMRSAKGAGPTEMNRTTGPAEGGITKAYPHHQLMKLRAGGNGG
jgi:hypothetical protein